MKTTKIYLYVDQAGKHRWRKKILGVITGASTQGYASKSGAISNLESEQGGTFYRDKVRGGHHGVPDFVKGKRRLGVLHRDNGTEIVVLELEHQG